MIQPADREYAGVLAAIMLAAKLVRDGPGAFSAESVTECAGVAARLVAAVDVHMAPAARKRRG